MKQMTQTNCGLWLTDRSVSLRIWFMGYESFFLKPEITKWLCDNTPDFHLVDDTRNEYPRVMTFQTVDHAALFREVWEDQVIPEAWELDQEQ